MADETLRIQELMWEPQELLPAQAEDAAGGIIAILIGMQSEPRPLGRQYLAIGDFNGDGKVDAADY